MQGASSIADKLETWEAELKNDKDKRFLLQGIREGFRIIDKDSVIVPAECKNHKSALNYKQQVEKELLDQIRNGQYIVSDRKPAIVSALAAIPKDEKASRVRIIHDGSRPDGSAMNDYASMENVKFQTLDEACKMAKPGYWFAKIDLQKAYRSVALHPDNYQVTGLKWHFTGEEKPTYLFDARLPFGSRCGPSHFHRLSQAVRRCMYRRGFKDLCVYIDDFLIVEKTQAECEKALHCLIRLLRELGFCVSWEKVVGPTQHITFLGVDLDSRTCTLSLGEVKRAQVQQKLQEFSRRKRASKRQLQGLAGLLNWACKAVRGGRFFLRRILDSIKALKQQQHKAHLGVEFRRDLQWWLTYLSVFNGTVYYSTQSTEHVHVDACRTATGAFWRGDWTYSVFACDRPAAAGLHINYKEVCAVLDACKRWAPQWRNCSVIIHTDNTTAKAVINKGRSKNKFINSCLRKLFWLSVRFNFTLRAIHVPGQVNILPDTVSRLHEQDKLGLLLVLLSQWYHSPVQSLHLPWHMSQSSAVFLCRRSSAVRKGAK